MEWKLLAGDFRLLHARARSRVSASIRGRNRSLCMDRVSVSHGIQHYSAAVPTEYGRQYRPTLKVKLTQQNAYCVSCKRLIKVPRGGIG